jgi:hypothetical protein
MATKTRKQQLADMLAEDPTDSFLRYGLAMECVSEGNDEEAVRCFGEMFTATPDYVPAYHQAGQALVRLGRSDEAKDVLQRGILMARRQGENHTADEMQGLLDSLA